MHILVGGGSQSGRLLTVRFQLHDNSEKAKLWRQEKVQWLPGVRGKGKLK